MNYGDGNPTPGWYGYPLNFQLLPSAVVLDISSIHSAFCELAFPNSELSARENFWNAVISRDADTKVCTQLIALAAAHAGFDGIIYTSVRAPIDVVMPECNLVMFNAEKIKLGAPPENP